MALSLNYTAPDEAVAAAAASAVRALGALSEGKIKRKGKQRVTLEARDDSHRARAEVPMEVFRLFVRLLTELAQGHAVSIVPIGKELTTQQAADLLNVSRPYLIQLLEEDRIPYRKVGTRRRIRFQDLLAFKKLDDADRLKVANELTKEAEKLELDD